MTAEEIKVLEEAQDWKRLAAYYLQRGDEACAQASEVCTRYNLLVAMNRELRDRADGKIEAKLHNDINEQAKVIEAMDLDLVMAKEAARLYRAQIMALGYVPAQVPTEKEILERNDAKVEGREVVPEQRKIEVS